MAKHKKEQVIQGKINKLNTMLAVPHALNIDDIIKYTGNGGREFIEGDGNLHGIGLFSDINRQSMHPEEFSDTMNALKKRFASENGLTTESEYGPQKIEPITMFSEIVNIVYRTPLTSEINKSMGRSRDSRNVSHSIPDGTGTKYPEAWIFSRLLYGLKEFRGIEKELFLRMYTNVMEDSEIKSGLIWDSDHRYQAVFDADGTEVGNGRLKNFGSNILVENIDDILVVSPRKDIGDFVDIYF